MAITKLNSLAIPPNTIVESDLSYPLTNFSSTGIDDNATSTAVTIDASENVGIGEASPNSVLHVNSGTGNNTAFFESTDNGAIVSIADNAGSIQLRAIDTGDFVVQVGGDGATTGTNSTEAMRITSSGNVGIGTTSPVDLLHIKTTSADAEITLETTNLGGDARLRMVASSSGVSSLQFQDENDSNVGFLNYEHSTNSMQFRTNDSEKMRLDNSGNLGIGTTSPTSYWTQADNLVIEGSGNEGLTIATTAATGNGRLAFVNTTTGTPGLTNGGLISYNHGSDFMSFGVNGSERMRIDSNGQTMLAGSTAAFDNTGAVNGLQFHYTTTTGKGVIGTYSSGGSTSLAFRTNSGGAGAATDNMIIDSSGNVGIGTTSPSSYGYFAVDRGAPASTDRTIAAFMAQSTRRMGLVWDDSQSTLGLANLTSQDLCFHIGGIGGASEKMRLTSSGNVGIGTESPESLLHIEGNQTEAKLTLGRSSSNTTGNVLGVLQFKNEDGSSDGPNIVANIQAVVPNSNGSGGYLKFGTHDGTEGGEGSSPVDRMTIDWLGRVGIGTTSPLYELSQHVSDSGANYHQFTNSTTGTASSAGFVVGIGGGEEATLWNYQSTAMRFATSSTERMRIDSAGNLIVGKTVTTLSTVGSVVTPSGTSTQTANFATTNQVHIYNQLDTSGTSQVDFRVAGFSKGRIQWTNTATSYITSSDQRLKENIVDAPAGNIDAIRVRSFDWKADGSHQTYGMVAQELVDVAPEAVSQGQTEDDMWGVDYSKLVPMMIKEIQDLKAEVAALKGA